jgi:hypothetical protein
VRKIISLFQRNYGGDHLVRGEVVPGAEWVIAGEGTPTRKYDGTCCLIRDGRLYRRFDAKRGKSPPGGFIPAQDPDPVTGHWPGWLLVDFDNPADRWHAVASIGRSLVGMDGTWELCGPKINGNPEGLLEHQLLRHGYPLDDCDARDYLSIRDYLSGKDIEGIVWHHPDGRMVKIKKRDFGLDRNTDTSTLSAAVP